MKFGYVDKLTYGVIIFLGGGAKGDNGPEDTLRKQGWTEDEIKQVKMFLKVREVRT